MSARSTILDAGTIPTAGSVRAIHALLRLDAVHLLLHHALLKVRLLLILLLRRVLLRRVLVLRVLLRRTATD